MNECTLHNLLTSCQFPQVFWIYRTNDYDENILLAKGTKMEMLASESAFDLIDHINDIVEVWSIRSDGAMFVKLKWDERAKDIYNDSYVKRWDRLNPHTRPWLFSAELDIFTEAIYGTPDYLHPYGDPLECHNYKEWSDSE